MKNIATQLLFLLLFIADAQAQVSLVNFATGFTRPCDITHCNDDRLFVVEQGGKIWILTKAGTKLPTPFLDIDPRVGSGGNEQGLLGLAFHPNYAQNGFFYVNYTDNSGDTKISRFSVSATDPNVANPNSELILLAVDQPYSNHNGGCVKFGPDGYLYIGLGDGGSGGDPQGYGQNRNSLLGKMLRIDVDGGSPYGIPASNPFVNSPTTLDEIWALGLRNPWRFSFDRQTGDLWMGDVGQNEWEEIDFQPASSVGGENYGWRCYEGTHPFNTNNCPNVGTLTMPVAEYENSSPIGCSVTGGFVYRGFNYPQLFGKYLYTDYCTGRLWTVVPNGIGGWTNTQLADFLNNQLVSFGENRNGDLFMLGLSNGTVYRLRDATEEWTYQITSTPAVCSNANTGSIQINFSQNTPTPSIAWSDGGTGTTRTGLANGSYTATITGTNGAVVIETIALVPAQTVSFSTATTNASCPNATDGSIDLTLEGTNNPPATVSWNDGSTDFDRNGLAAGLYNVTVTSAEGCVFEEAFSIAVANPVSLVSSITDVTCVGEADGNIQLVLEGTSSAPTSVVWDDGGTGLHRTNLAVGEYNVILTSAEGCILEGMYEINALNSLSLTAHVSDVNCPNASNGSIGLTLVGTSNPPAAIVWSDGSTELDRTGLAAGQYSVTVTSSEGCSHVESFEIAVSSNISLTGTVTNVPCAEAANGSIGVVLNGSTITNAIWSDGNTNLNRTGLSAGSYAVTVTSAEGCTFEETFTIAVSNSISLSSLVNNIPCSNADDGSIQLSLIGSNEALADVLWSDGSDALLRTDLAAGQYAVTVTSSEGCVFEADFEITVAAILSLTGNVESVPCAEAMNGYIDLTLEGTNQPIVSALWNDGSTEFDRTGLVAGNYSVTVTSTEGCVLEEAFTINISPTISLSGIVTEASCAEAANGGIALLLEGSNLPNASVLWNDGSTNPDRTNLTLGAYSVTVTSEEGCVLEETFAVSNSNAISLLGATSDVPCAEAAFGSIDLTILGSNAPPASVIWNDGSTEPDRTGLTTGAYSVTLTSAEGCVFQETFAVGNLNAISLLGATSDVPCAEAANGSVDLTLVGSDAPPTTVLWNDGSIDFDRTGLMAGNYSVTLTSAEGCIFEAGFEVISLNSFSLIGQVTDITCLGQADGSIDLTINGATEPTVTVLWSDGSIDLDRTNLAAGAYSVNVTSVEGCVFEETFVVDSTNAVSVSAEVNGVFCSGDSNGSIHLTLDNSSNGTAGVNWSDGSIGFDRLGLSVGDYGVSVTTEEGCLFIENFILEAQFQSPMPVIANQNGNEFVLEVNDIFASYQWFRDGLPIQWANTSTYHVSEGGVSEGNYTVEVTDANGCKGISNSIYVSWNAATTIKALQSVKVSPNPFTQQVQLELMVSEPVTLQILLRDLQGREVFAERLTAVATTVRSFNLAHLPSGTYFLILKNEREEWVKEVVKL
jgi:glucose/arabinose dehydrogenase